MTPSSCFRTVTLLTIRVSHDSGSSYPSGGRYSPGVLPNRAIVKAFRDFFSSYLLFFFPYSLFSSYLPPLFLYLISLLMIPCASVWENTRAWVHISYSHTEWHFIFSRGELVWPNICSSEKKIIIIMLFFGFLFRNVLSPAQICKVN